MCGAWIASMVAGVALIGCATSSEGDESSAKGDATREDRAELSACIKARKELIATLERSLTAGGRLERVYTVKVSNPPEAPQDGYKHGVFVASGKVTDPRRHGQLVSWAISRDMRHSGGGLAIGIDNVTRELSDRGADLRAWPPALDYVREIRGTDAFDQARECAEG